MKPPIEENIKNMVDIAGAETKKNIPILKDNEI
jgi:hypothetical protein